MPRISAAAWTRFSISSFGNFRIWSPNDILAYTDLCGYSA